MMKISGTILFKNLMKERYYINTQDLANLVEY